MPEQIYIDPPVEGLAVRFDTIITKVGDCHRGDTVIAPIQIANKLKVMRNKLVREYPYSKFELSTKYIKRSLHLKVKIK